MIKLFTSYSQGDMIYVTSSCAKILLDFELQEALQHPVVRMFIKTKWKSYGHFFIR